MKRLVADAATIAGWFGGGSAALRSDYEAGTLVLVEPRSVTADVVAELAARTAAGPDVIAQVADEVDRLGFELRDPPTRDVAHWIARGLDPRRAAYAAVAEGLDLALVTDDRELRRAAGPRARGADDA